MRGAAAIVRFDDDDDDDYRDPYKCFAFGVSRIMRMTNMLFQSILRIPWLSFAKCLPLYALAIAHFTNNWGFFTLLSCLPQYFEHILHFDLKSVSAEDPNSSRFTEVPSLLAYCDLNTLYGNCSIVTAFTVYVRQCCC